MKTHYKILFATLLTASVFLCGYVGSNATLKKPPRTDEITLTKEQEESIGLLKETVQKRRINVQITIPAQFKVITYLTSNVYSPVDGKVVEVYVEQGQNVHKGQALARIQSDYVGQIQSELLGNIIELDANIKMSSAQVNFAKNTYERENILLNEKITSRQEWENAKTIYQKELANLNALKAKRAALASMYRERLSLYGADRSVVERVLSTHKIYPFITLYADKKGRLLNRYVNPQEFVSANKELFVVADLTKVWLSGFLHSKDMTYVRTGDSITAETEEQGGLLKIEGKITYIAPSIDENTKTLEVRAEVDDPKDVIRPNKYAQMTVTIGKIDAITVPKGALQQIGDTTVAFVEAGPNIYLEKKVETGEQTQDYVEIKSGLSEGETVVTKGSFALLGESLKKNEEQ